MEEKRCRRNSVSSVHSQSNYSIANVQCSGDHTHAIVQREKVNKVILVPLDCFINFGKIVKANETATYKLTTDSRKSERGKVLLFGSEDLCVEQLQVIQEENIEEDQLSGKTKCKYMLRCPAIKKAFAQLRKILNFKKINMENYVMDGATTQIESSKINEIDDQFDASPSKKINLASSITVGSPTRFGKKTSQVKRKLFNDNTEFLSTNENIFG
ncbi:unnamed protein product, partial [Rotaria sp. Silwood1]